MEELSLFNVCVDNGYEYEDMFEEIDVLIVAKSKEEAETRILKCAKKEFMFNFGHQVNYCEPVTEIDGYTIVIGSGNKITLKKESE
ncbi:hypothetical protein [Bacillus bombysepticus]|uniref:hypothetical protein n=1 Tax=Bacillus bombysepticus TaxID=658666 RepID=UPI003015E92F